MPEKKQTSLKIFFKWVFRIFLAFVVLLILFGFLATLPPGENLIRWVAQNKLQKTLGQPVKIGDLETNLFSRLQLRQVKILQGMDSRQFPLVQLGYARVDFRLLDLLKHKISIRSLIFDSLRINVFRSEAGMVYLPALFTAEKKSPAPDTATRSYQFSLGTFSLKNAALKYTDRAVPIRGTLEQLDVNLHQLSPDVYRFAGKIQTGRIVYDANAIPVNRLHLNGSYAGEQLAIDSLTMKFPGVNLEANLNLDFRVSPAPLKGKLRVWGDTGSLSSIFKNLLPPLLRPFEGKLDAVFDISGTLQQPRIQTTVRFSGLQTEKLMVQGGLVKAEYMGDQIRLDKLELNLLGGSLAGGGVLRLDEQLSHDFSFSLSQINFARVWQMVFRKSVPYQALLNGKITSQGPLKNPELMNASARFALTKVTYQSNPLEDFTTTLAVSNGRAEVEFRHADASLYANLNLSEKKLQGNYRLSFPDVRPVVRLFDFSEVSGSLKANGKIAGSREMPIVTTEFSGKNLRYKNMPLDEITGKMIYRNQTVRLEKVEFRGQLAQIDTLHPPFGLSDLQGGVSYNGSLWGTPDSLDGEFFAVFRRIAYHQLRFNSGKLKADLKNGHIDLHLLQLRNDSLQIRLTGRYDIPQTGGAFRMTFLPPDSIPEKQLPGRTDLTGYERTGFQQYPDYGVIETRVDLSDSTGLVMRARGSRLNLQRVSSVYPFHQSVNGLLRFGLNFKGSMKKPHGELSFSIHDVRWADFTSDSVTAGMHIEPGRFYLDSLKLQLGNQYSLTSAEIAMKRDSTGNFMISGSSFTRGETRSMGLDLQVFKPLLGKDVHLAGLSSFHLKWSGPLKNPDFRGEFAIQNGAFQAERELPAIRNLEVGITLADSLILIKDFSGTVRDSPFRLTGQITTRRWTNYQTRLNLIYNNVEVLSGSGVISREELDFELNINEFNLSFLQTFNPGVKNLAGTFNAMLSLKGSVSEPNIKGGLNIRGLTFQIPFLKSPFTDGIVKINFRENRVTVDSVRLRHGDGMITVSGNFLHQSGQIKQLSFTAKIRKTELEYRNQFKLLIESADLKYRKTNDTYSLNGDVILGESKISYNIEPRQIVSMFRKAEKPAPTPPEILTKTRLNIRIPESRNIWIDNNLARLRLNSDLNLVGSPASPNITGRLTVEEGYVFYLDRKFEVKTGILDFVNPNRINPIVDLQAQAMVTSYQALESTPYTISFSIKGPVNEAVIKLSSVPPLSQTDILALLTLGATSGQLTGQEGGEGLSTTEILRQRVEALSSQKITGYVTGKVANLLGLEQLSIQGNIFDMYGHNSAPRLIASKRISDRLKITYTTNVGQLNENGIRLDYRLSNHFSLQGLTDQKGNSGIDLKYRIQFK